MPRGATTKRCGPSGPPWPRIWHAILEEEGTFGGYTIPTRGRVAWWMGTDRYLEVIRFKVEQAELS